MVQINFAQKTVNVKIVYYGPGMSGKTTNLEVVHQRAPDDNRGELTSISTDGDRTLFFDYMPLSLGTVAGMRTCFQLYTVPGQVYYNSTRKLVLQGVDGVIFVADSSPTMLDQNLEALRNLEENLNEYGKSMTTLPHVLQWNKRDLPGAMAVEEMNRLMNHNNAPHFEAIANTGQGVFPTLKALAAAVLKNIMQETAGGKGFGQSAAAAPAAPAAPAPAPAAAPSEPFPQPAAATPAPPPLAPPPAPPMAPPPAPPLRVAAQAPVHAAPQPMAPPQARPVAVAHESGASNLMRQRPRPAQQPRRTRPPGTPGRGAAARAGRQRAAAAATRPARSGKSGAGKIVLFAILAAGVGAGIAMAALKYLPQAQ